MALRAGGPGLSTGRAGRAEARGVWPPPPRGRRAARPTLNVTPPKIFGLRVKVPAWIDAVDPTRGPEKFPLSAQARRLAGDHWRGRVVGAEMGIGPSWAILSAKKPTPFSRSGPFR